MNYASTSNIREVIKFYDLGDKTFETDFKSHYQYNRRYAVWDELLEKRGITEFFVTSIKNNQEPLVGYEN